MGLAVCKLALLCTLLLSCAAFARPAAAEDQERTVVQVNLSTVLALPRGYARIIVGDASKLRVALISGNSLAVLTGTAFGATSLTVLDAQGSVILERSVLVKDPSSSSIEAQRGIERTTQTGCEDRCQRTQALGDADAAFSAAAAQQEAIESAVRAVKPQAAPATASAPAPVPAPSPAPPASNPGSRKRDQL